MDKRKHIPKRFCGEAYKLNYNNYLQPADVDEGRNYEP